MIPAVLRIRLGFAIPCTGLALAGVIAYLAASHLSEATGWVEHTHKVLVQIQTVSRQVTDWTTAQRLSLRVANHKQTGELQRRATDVNHALKELSSLTADNPDQVRRSTELIQLTQAWSRLFNDAYALRTSHGIATAEAVLTNSSARVLLDRIWTLLQDLHTSEARLLQNRYTQARASAQRAMTLIVRGTLLALLLSLLAAVWLSRSVTTPIAKLVAAADTLGSGNLSHRIDATRDDAFGSLAHALNQMAVNLQESRRESKQYSEAIASERALLRTLIDHLPQQIFVEDLHRRYAVVNRAFAAAHCSDGQCLPHTSYQDGTTASLAHHPIADAVFTTGAAVHDHQERITDTAGHERWLSTTTLPLHDDKGHFVGVVGISHDITEHRATMEHIQRLNTDLQLQARALARSNRDLEAFSYSVSHDLRAPLRHLDGYANLLMKHSGDALDEKARRYVEIISGASKDLGRLIDDLLAFARMGQAELRASTSPLDALVWDVIRDLDRHFPNRSVHWTVAALPTVIGDPTMLRLVFVNLLSNALKYTQPRDVAEIEVGYRNAPDSDMVIFVRDNGVGFDMEYAHKLFGVFQRLHGGDQFEGTGIGLATVRRIIHRHGGETWAEGVVDHGATMFFSLPRSTEVSA